MEQVLPFINLAGIGILGFGFLYNNWRSGKDQVSSQVVSLYKEQVEALDTEVKRGRERNHDLANEMQKIVLKQREMEIKLAEKDKKLDEYMRILENRDPGLEEALKSMERVAISLESYMKTKTDILEDIQEKVSRLGDKTNVI